MDRGGKYEIIARGVISHENKVLLCQSKQGGYHYFPGGHVGLKETAEEALARELKEELGLEPKDISFMGVMEYAYKKKGEVYHEINLVFKVEVKIIKKVSKEDHINFEFISKEELISKNVLPKILRNKVDHWFKNTEIFWASDASSELN